MDMSFMIVSFYTERTPYEKEVNNLVNSLDKLGLCYYVKGVRSLGSWEKNCQYKAQFIMDAMNASDRNIVWIDADAVIMRYPSLFDTLDCDIAYHYLEKRKELLSGTLFIRNNQVMRSLVQRWIAVNASNNRWDQKNLQQVVEADSSIIKYILPADYCKIYDNNMQSAADPVITHFQASRRFRKMIQPIVNVKRR
jgi:spore coat protein CotF